jgi:glycosyltransferase involved in cell wall biosynthesis
LSYSNNETVTIIIPCYNAEKWIADTLDSCLNQTYKSVEVIVIDDGSTDGSAAILKRYYGSVRIESGPNQGANRARNRGLDLAAGNYIKFLDADDLIESGAIEAQMKELMRTGADVCYGDWRHVKNLTVEEMKYFPIIKAGPRDNIILSLLRRWWCPPLAFLMKKRFILENNCSWDANLKISQDFDFMLNIALRGASFCYIPVLIGAYRHHDGERISRRGIMPAIEANETILKRTETYLTQTRGLNTDLRRAICSYYLALAKMAFGVDRQLFKKMIAQIRRLDPEFRIGKRYYDMAVNILGYEKTEWLLEQRRRMRNVLDHGKEYYER